MDKIHKAAMTLLLFSQTLIAEAHTGVIHIGTVQDGINHFFSSFDHLLILMLGVWIPFKLYGSGISEWTAWLESELSHYRSEHKKL